MKNKKSYRFNLAFCVFIAIIFFVGIAFAEDAIFVDADGNVGIGTSSPSGKLHVIDASGTPGIHITGEDNIWFNDGQVRMTTDEDGSWLIRQGNDNEDRYCGAGLGAIKMYMTRTGFFRIYVAGSGTVGSDIGWKTGLSIDYIGRVGIGKYAYGYKLDVNGPARATGWYTFSDKRFKKNIKDLEGSLSKIDKLQGVSYDWDKKNNPEEDLPEGSQIGFIAQDVEEIFPEVVRTDDEGNKAIEYGKLTAVLVEAIKELKAENDYLIEQNNTLEDRMSEIEDALAAIVSKQGGKKDSMVEN